MPIDAFPPVELADEYGLLALGGDLTVSTLLLAYSSGIFPWPNIFTEYVPWFAPPERALLFLDEFTPPKSLQKLWKKNPYNFKINKAFRSVITQCAEADRSEGTWITKDMIEAYCEFHRAGYAHSIECYLGSELVGGLYGVSLGKMFAGESMFYIQPNTSKLCLYFLVEHLKKQNCKWIDCQQLTQMFKKFGAREVQREEFMKLLGEAKKSSAISF